MKRFLLASLVILGFAAFASADDATLVQTLAKQLNVTEEQAAGGAGAIFNYAKSALPTNEYAKVESAVPEAIELVKKAPAADSTTSAVGGAVGKAGGTAAGLANLGSSFQKLGLSSDMVGQFVPVVVDYVDKKGGSEVGSLLKNVLTPAAKKE
jgi:Protein of unknown function VcgC/VcgE (DUF2780)